MDGASGATGYLVVAERRFLFAMEEEWARWQPKAQSQKW
jgi:hypothetical protein